MRWSRLLRWRRRGSVGSAPWPMCRDLMERLSDYLDGAVSDVERAAIDAHLAECDGCTEAVEQFRMTIRSVGALHVEDVAAIEPDLRDRLLDAFRAGTVDGPERGSA